MITEPDRIRELFDRLSEHISGECSVFMVGGGAMMTYRLKSATKDIDIIVEDQTVFDRMEEALLEIGFEPKIPDSIYGRLNISNIYIKDDYRIDMFSERICGKLSLSKKMIDRSHLHSEHGKLRLYVCSLEDILLLKSITDREGDYEDCRKICRHDIDWDSFFDEMVSQSRGEHEVWITYISDRLTALSEAGFFIPILDSVQRMAEEYLERWSGSLLRRQTSGVSEKKARIVRSSCKGCHECVELCPSEAISFEDGGAYIDQDRCTGCGSCVTICRFDAIILRT